MICYDSKLVNITKVVNGKTEEFVILYDEDDLKYQIDELGQDIIRLAHNIDENSIERMTEEFIKWMHSGLSLYHHLTNIKNGDCESLKLICDMYGWLGNNTEKSIKYDFDPILSEELRDIFTALTPEAAQEAIIEYNIGKEEKQMKRILRVPNNKK